MTCPDCGAETWPVYRPAGPGAHPEERLAVDGLGWCPECEDPVEVAPEEDVEPESIDEVVDRLVDEDVEPLGAVDRLVAKRLDDEAPGNHWRLSDRHGEVSAYVRDVDRVEVRSSWPSDVRVVVAVVDSVADRTFVLGTVVDAEVSEA